MSNEQSIPWKDDPTNFIGCNFALGDLANNLPRRLTIDGKLHAETFAAASGAIAGFAAQQALLAQRPGFSIDALDESTMSDGLFIVRDPRGERYLFGNPLKEMLFCKEPPVTEITARLWEWATGAALSAGLDQSELPHTLTMWESVNDALREGREQPLSVPQNHWPHLSVVQSLELLWPMAKQFLTGKGSGASAPASIVVVETHWWPSITAMLASSAIQQVKDVLDPRTALTIVMETALVALKTDPTKFEGVR